MVKKKIFTKLLAVLMLIVTILGMMPISVFAKYITEIDDDAKFGVVSGSLSDYGHELHYAKYDSKTYLVFCAQYGETSPGGGTYEYDDEFKVELKEDRKSYKKICEMIYFGYVMKYGTGLPDSTAAKKAACATQQYVWEYIKNNINSDYGAPSRSSWNSKYMSSSIYSDWLKKAEDNYDKYHGKGISFDGKTKKIELGETKTYTDKNSVLETYPAFSQRVSGVTFAHEKGSNDLVVTVSENTDATTVKFKSYKYDIYQLLPNGDKFDSTKMSTYLYFHFSKGSIQNLLFSNYVDPESFTFNIGIESGELLLKKTDSNDMPLAGCQFRIFEDEACTEKIATATTDEKGEILFDGLSTGDIYIKEIKAAPGYLLDNAVKKVTITNGETSTVSFKNNEPTGKLLIYKVDSNGAKIGGAQFKVKAAEDIKSASGKTKYYSAGDIVATITSNETTGIATLDNMHLGKYIVYESVAPNRIFIK